jgi:tRNA-specific 2-thiouridylase
MSGGVDSSVAAHLLLEQGHEVVGVFMRHGESSPLACTAPLSSDQRPDSVSSTDKRPGSISSTDKRPDHKQGCCTAADAEDARRVADKLSIPFYALNLQQEFKQIIDYFVDEYSIGRTPNPCVQCNNWIKFGKLFEYADSIEATYVATGHYAKIETVLSGLPALLRGRDAHKDQSYVLFGIKQQFLRRMLLPVGDYEKKTIRSLATQLDLQVAEKKESQEICFVTQGRYDQFVRDRLNDRKQQDIQNQQGQVPEGTQDTSGELVSTDGSVLGRHEGIERFTVGQRKGLGVALGTRKFVVRIEPDTCRVVLGDREALQRCELHANGTNWLVDLTDIPRHCQVQIRYNAPPAVAVVELLSEQRIRVQFDQPQIGVAPGQAVVCYDDQRVLGGGWIE